MDIFRVQIREKLRPSLGEQDRVSIRTVPESSPANAVENVVKSFTPPHTDDWVTSQDMVEIEVSWPPDRRASKQEEDAAETIRKTVKRPDRC